MKRLTECLQGMGITSEKRVLIQLWGDDNHLPYLDAFGKRALEYSKHIKVHHHSLKKYAGLFEDENFVKAYDFTSFEKYDVVIDLLATSIAPTDDFSELAIAQYRNFMGQLFKRVMKAKTFVQLRLPTDEMASNFNLKKEVYLDHLSRGLDVDYKAIKNSGQQIISKLKTAREIIIETKNESLKLRFNQREWFNDCGDGDLPCGEVYTSCLENKSEGSIFIESTFFLGESFSNMILTFEEGLLVNSDHAKFMEKFDGLSEDCKRLGEFGIGTNYNLTKMIGNSLLDEKIKGTIHVALGRNNMFGGKNNGEIHHDFVVKPRRVIVDGKEIIV